jgi:capsular polysaccharide biosynthesis protein
VEPIRAEAARLSNLNLDMSQLKLVTIDQQALEPLKPIKPKKALIIVLGIMLGLVLGVMIAVVRHLFVLKNHGNRNEALRLSVEENSSVVSETMIPLSGSQ